MIPLVHNGDVTLAMSPSLPAALNLLEQIHKEKSQSGLLPKVTPQHRLSEYLANTEHCPTGTIDSLSMSDVCPFQSIRKGRPDANQLWQNRSEIHRRALCRAVLVSSDGQTTNAIQFDEMLDIVYITKGWVYSSFGVFFGSSLMTGEPLKNRN